MMLTLCHCLEVAGLEVHIRWGLNSGRKFSFLYHYCLIIIIIIIVIIIIIIIYSLEFFTSVLADGFHWSLSDSNSPQVSRTLLIILTVLNNVVVWMFSTRPLSSKSFSPFSNPFVTVII